MDDLFAGDDGFLAPPPTSQPESPVAQNGDVEPVEAEEQAVPDVVVAAPSPTSAHSGPTPVTSVVASPTSQNGGGGSSQPSASPARSPTVDDGGDFVSGSVSLKERGAKKVQKQLADVAARTAAQDVASIKKDKEIKAAAAAYLKDLSTKREQAINNTKADHMKEQQEYERKMKDLKTSGKLWDSVNLLVDGKKPNAFSKNTEYMRGLLVGMSSTDAAVKA